MQRRNERDEERQADLSPRLSWVVRYCHQRASEVAYDRIVFGETLLAIRKNSRYSSHSRRQLHKTFDISDSILAASI
jgi:hypothetical protein